MLQGNQFCQACFYKRELPLACVHTYLSPAYRTGGLVITAPLKDAWGTEGMIAVGVHRAVHLVIIADRTLVCYILAFRCPPRFSCRLEINVHPQNPLNLMTAIHHHRMVDQRNG